MTGQERFASYDEVNAGIALGLVNELATEQAYGRTVRADDALAGSRRVLDVDPPFPPVRQRDVPALAALATQLRAIVTDLDRGDVDGAAAALNQLLAAHPAHPHLAKERGRWYLHHHPADAALVPMVAAVSAHGLASVVGAGYADRIGVCASDDCERVFLDESKNGSRRFCSTTCQNRVKAAAFRRRQATRG